jgi:hypothetical protein
MALSCLPCSDKDDCTYKAAEQSALTTTDHSNHTNDTENCSPFCMCACCGQFCSFYHNQTDLALNIPTTSKKLAIYQVSYFSDVCFSIWQPPKIS